MQFKVPQFLDIEDKIFGPFTFSEFVYLAGGAGISFFLYRWLGFWKGSIPIAFIATLSLLLTFYKPNNKPFINMMESALVFLVQNKLYIWKRKIIKKKEIKKEKIEVKYATNQPRLNVSKLRNLAWSLDVLDVRKD